MRLNPSLTARLRIGFVILFALLLIVSLLGVGRLFQIRVDFEDETTRYFQLELETEQARSGFVLEQAASRPPAPGVSPDPAALEQAAQSFVDATDRAAEQTGDDRVLTARLERLVASETAWRQAVALPLVRGETPPAQAQQRLTDDVTGNVDALGVAVRGAREAVRDSAREDTRDTTIFVIAGLLGALLAALVLFSGLINSMRAPLSKLVEGARRLAGGDLDTRVEVGGPVEIATLGQAFNEMATSLETDAKERDRIERMKDDFVLTVSHELRTPVTVVKGFAEMLTAERKALSARQYEAASVISESAGQLQKMINDLLDLARSDAGKLRIEPEPTAVRALCQRVGRQMRPAFEAQEPEAHRQRREEDPRGPGRCGPHRPGAREPAYEREQVRQRGREGAPDRQQLRQRHRVPGLRRRARARGGGAGSRVREVLAGPERRDAGGRRHGPRPGDRQVPRRIARRVNFGEVRAGKGRYLHVRASDREEGDEKPQGLTHGHGGSEQLTRLLVADDSETVLLMLQRRLEMAGYDVDTATDGEEVLEALGKGAKPDLVLLDAMMPKKSGVDALREMREDGYDQPVLMISAHLDAQEPERMKAIGADGCVPKPFEWDELIARIEELL